MQAARLIGAFVAQRTAFTDVAAINQPDARQRDVFTIEQPIHDGLKNLLDFAFLGYRFGGGL